MLNLFNRICFLGQSTKLSICISSKLFNIVFPSTNLILGVTSLLSELVIIFIGFSSFFGLSFFPLKEKNPNIPPPFFFLLVSFGSVLNDLFSSITKLSSDTLDAVFDLCNPFGDDNVLSFKQFSREVVLAFFLLLSKLLLSPLLSVSNFPVS